MIQHERKFKGSWAIHEFSYPDLVADKWVSLNKDDWADDTQLSMRMWLNGEMQTYFHESRQYSGRTPERPFVAINFDRKGDTRGKRW